MAYEVGGGTIYKKTYANPTGLISTTNKVTTPPPPPSTPKLGDVVKTNGGDFKVVAPGTAGAKYNDVSKLWSVQLSGAPVGGTPAPVQRQPVSYQPPSAPSAPIIGGGTSKQPQSYKPPTVNPINKAPTNVGGKATTLQPMKPLNIGDPLGKGAGFLKDQFNKLGSGVAGQYVTPERKVLGQTMQQGNQQMLGKVAGMVVNAAGKAAPGVEKYLQTQGAKGMQQYAANPQAQQLGKTMTAELAKGAANYQKSPLAQTMDSATGLTRGVADLFSPAYSADAVGRGTAGALEKADVAASMIPFLGPLAMGAVKGISKAIKMGDGIIDLAKVGARSGGFAEAIAKMPETVVGGAASLKQTRVMTMQEFGKKVSTTELEVIYDTATKKIIGLDDTGKRFVVKISDAPITKRADDAAAVVKGDGTVPKETVAVKADTPVAPRGPETGFVRAVGDGTTQKVYTPDSNFPKDYKGTLDDVKTNAKTLYKVKTPGPDGETAYRLTLRDGSKHTIDNKQFPELSDELTKEIGARAKAEGLVKPNDRVKEKIPKKGNERSAKLLNKWADEGATERAVKGRIGKEVADGTLTKTQGEIALEAFKIRKSGVVPDDVYQGARKAIENQGAGNKAIPALEAYLKGLQKGKLTPDSADALVRALAPDLKLETGHLRTTLPKMMDELFPKPGAGVDPMSPKNFFKAADETTNPIEQIETAAGAKVAGVEKTDTGWKVTLADGKKVVKADGSVPPEYAKMLDDMAAGKTADEAAPPKTVAEKYMEGSDVTEAEKAAAIKAQQDRAKAAREAKEAELGRKFTSEEKTEFNKAWYKEDNKTSGLKETAAAGASKNIQSRGNTPQADWDALVLADARKATQNLDTVTMDSPKVTNAMRKAGWKITYPDGTHVTYKRADVSPNVAKYMDDIRDGEAHIVAEAVFDTAPAAKVEAPAAKAADTTPAQDYLEGKPVEEIAPADARVITKADVEAAAKAPEPAPAAKAADVSPEQAHIDARVAHRKAVEADRKAQGLPPLTKTERKALNRKFDEDNPIAKADVEAAAKAPEQTLAAKAEEPTPTGGTVLGTNKIVDDPVKQTAEAVIDLKKAQATDALDGQISMDDMQMPGEQVAMDLGAAKTADEIPTGAPEPTMRAALEPEAMGAGAAIPGTNPNPPAGGGNIDTGGGASDGGAPPDSTNPIKQDPRAPMSKKAKFGLGITGVAGAGLVAGTVARTSDQSGAGVQEEESTTPYTDDFNGTAGTGPLGDQAAPVPGPQQGGGPYPQMPSGGATAAPGAPGQPDNGGYTETVFWMPDENGELSGPYRAVIDSEGWAYMVNEDGSIERVPEGAVVEAGGNDMANEETGMTGSGMWQRVPGGSEPFDPENPYIPQLADILDEELDAVIQENGGYTVDNIMETYAPYLENQNAMIDQQTEQQIIALREQLAARGMYNADIALTLEQQIRDGGEQLKANLYQEVLMNAQQQAMEFERWNAEMALKRDTLDFSQYDADRNFNQAQTNADRNYQFDVEKFNWDKETDVRDYNLDVYKANKVGAPKAPAGTDPDIYEAIYTELGTLMMNGAPPAQVTSHARAMINAGYVDSATMSKIINDAQSANNAGFDFQAAYK